MQDEAQLKPLTETWVHCPKHGTHKHVIRSTIPEHEGVWCQICWLEMMGSPLPSEQRPFTMEIHS